jgi:hypothetical protein
MDQDALGAMSGTVSHLLEMMTLATGGAARSYDELFALACRKVDEIAPVNVSRAAQEMANELELDDLRTYCWFCRSVSTHREGGRRLFLWEHYHPVGDIQKELLGLGPSPRLGQVSEILAKTKIVWVLRREGDALGNRTRTDPGATYRDAGVDLLHRWEECGPIDCKRHRSR